MISNEEANEIADGLISHYEQLAREWLASVSDEDLQQQLERIASKMESACDAIGAALLQHCRSSSCSMMEQITLTTICDTLDILRDTVRAIRDPSTTREDLPGLLGWASAAMEVSIHIIDTFDNQRDSDYGFSYN